MKEIYTVIITETTDKKMPYLVYVPDFDVVTEGKDLNDALYMAEDIISLCGVDYEDDGKFIPTPTAIDSIDMSVSHWADVCEPSEIITEFKTLVPVDFDLYRKKLQNTAVRRNVSLPAWLDAEASKAGINVSAVLQNALKAELHTV
ncbi:MAG: type II toxin-antitoxin system HicB family antitoxin [Clostridiales Family XIII bacterium]|jgi:predicted RNase H-like HicB family nuclease|nr:type II toxin-antitoxin system HicB family antitoxin [Clostridiales Family XIII bacterium]